MIEEVTLAEMIRRANDVKQDIKVVLEMAGEQMTDVPFQVYPDKIQSALRRSCGGGDDTEEPIPDDIKQQRKDAREEISRLRDI